MKFSIIIPAYNVADYLKDCLNSLLKQGVPEKELQIILVDDGSTDNSAQIAQKFVELLKHDYIDQGKLGKETHSGFYDYDDNGNTIKK